MKIIFQYMFSLIFCFLLLTSCNDKSKSDRILLDFESDQVLDQLHWNCHVLYFLSDEHAAHGSRSLKIELFPSSTYPGLSPGMSKKDKDWSCYNLFSFNVFNPSQETIRLVVRIDDKKEALKYSDRYNKSFQIVPGNNKISIDLDDLKTSISERPMDLDHIYRFLVFMSHPEKQHTLYLDYFLLSKGGSIEGKK